jgi:hypothetical protein
MTTSGSSADRMRLLPIRFSQVLGYLWLAVLGVSLLLSAHAASRRSMQVEEYALGCDPFGYLTMARAIRQAAANLKLPQFHLESPQTRLLIDLMRSHNVSLQLWDEFVAPHAHHYFPEAGHVGVQYPPGTGIALSFFPEGEAVHSLNQMVIWLFLASGLALLIFAGARQSWMAAGGVVLAVNLGLEILGWVQTKSFSINAILAPLFLSCLCVCAALWLRSVTKRLRLAWLIVFIGGGLLGFAIVSRLPVIFLVPGFLVLLWPSSWRPRLAALIIPFCLGVLLIGVLPVLVHQERLAGAWYLPTYGRWDTAPPSLAALGKNAEYYLGEGRGTRGNGALVYLLIGLGGLAAFRGQRRPGGLDLSWTRLLLSGLTLWGLPMAYFLTHPISISYYPIPATFGTAALLALGALTIDSQAARPRSPIRLSSYARRGWIALIFVLALLPGLATLGRTWSLYTHAPNVLRKPAQRLTLPTEMSEERAWVWADILTGTLWYYADKPAFKIGFSDPATRALVYRFVFERGEPQYAIRDSVGMQVLLEEIADLGGILEERGEVDTHPYFLIRWPEGGPMPPR